MIHSIRFVSILVLAGCIVLDGSARAAEPDVGACLTANENSFNFAKEQKLRAERDQLLICTASSCPAQVQKECERRADAVGAAIPTVIFEVKDNSGRIVRDVNVIMDGEMIADHLDGTALEVDPGEHRFSFEVEGKPRFERQISFEQRQKNRHEAITFVPLADAAMPTTPGQLLAPTPAIAGASASTTATPAAAPTESGRSSASMSRPERGDFMDSQRLAAVVSGGVGIVGVAIGSYFGLRAISKRNSARIICPGHSCSNRDGVDRWNDAWNAGNNATVGFIIGGVGLAGAAVLWFTDSPTRSYGAELSVGPRSVELRGNW